ncbi:hypothetical protein [Halorussus sp. AFM4]|uniref:hypothetical protein n=1 Tax=Halorussus sp. AFM4 TaxID=3421651 RepID=UPI003EB8E3BB
MANDPYTDDEYDDTYREVHGDEPAADRDAVADDDTGFFGYGPRGEYWPTGWGLWPGGDTVDADQDMYGYQDPEYGATDEEDDGSWLDEGLIATFLIVGAVLFFFPEPTTSAVGIAMLAMGVMGWVVDWAM